MCDHKKIDLFPLFVSEQRNQYDPAVFPFEWFYNGYFLGPFIACCSVGVNAPC